MLDAVILSASDKDARRTSTSNPPRNSVGQVPRAQPYRAPVLSPQFPLLLYFHAALSPRIPTLGQCLSLRRHFLAPRLFSIPPPRIPRHLRLSLSRSRQSHDPRSRPSLLQLGWQHLDDPRRHPRRTSRPSALWSVLLFPRSNLRLHLLRLLVFRKFSLHWHVHEGRPRRRPSPRQRRHRRLDYPLRSVGPSPR